MGSATSGSGLAATESRVTSGSGVTVTESGVTSGSGLAATESTLGVDVGGTFTDIALWDGENITVGKVPTTSHDQSEGVMHGAQNIVPSGVVFDLLHGTTVATNALLERRGAKTLLVTDAGFESLIEIARQDRPSLYEPLVDRARPLVAAELRVGIKIPADATDAELDKTVDAVIEKINSHDVDAVAVCMMYSYEDPSMENLISGRLRERLLAGRASAIPVSSSAEVVAEFREYERFSTTVVNAFLSPEVKRYMSGLAKRAESAGSVEKTAVIRSSGGLVSLDHASDFPASILLSGPAGGVVASAALGEQIGCDKLISFDMGGTSTDVCRVIENRPQLIYNREIAGHACMMPSVAVNTVGAGGGSVAWADSGGALRVGPRSAGASPGPVCYDGGGKEPTVTDANLVLGRLDANTELAGELSLRQDLAFNACEQLGSELSLDPVNTALGIVSVVESHMIHAIRSVSVEQGTDPRDAVLVVFGGAGGLHATALAKSLDMDGVIIPPYAGVFSAFGLLLSAPRVDLAQTVNLTGRAQGGSARDGSVWGGSAREDGGTRDDGVQEDTLVSVAERLIASALVQIKSDSGQKAQNVKLVADMRYTGQAHETSVPYELGESWHRLCEKFHRLHAQRNGFSLLNDPVEVVTVRVEATGLAPLSWPDLPEFVPEPGDPRRSSRTVIGLSGSVTTAVWWRPSLAPGTVINGPAIIEEGESTAYLAQGEHASVHETGALNIGW